MRQLCKVKLLCYPNSIQLRSKKQNDTSFPLMKLIQRLRLRCFDAHLFQTYAPFLMFRSFVLLNQNKQMKRLSHLALDSLYSLVLSVSLLHFCTLVNGPYEELLYWISSAAGECSHLQAFCSSSAVRVLFSL